MIQIDTSRTEAVGGGKTAWTLVGCSMAATGAAIGLASAATGVGALAAGLSAFGGALACGSQMPGGGFADDYGSGWSYAFGA